MYSSGRSSGGSRTTVELPPGMPIGAVIGRGGSNVRLLQQRSGAKVTMLARGEVVVAGSPGCVEEAVRLLRLQISAFQASGGGYPHPLQALYLLSAEYGSSGGGLLEFERRLDQVALAAGRSEQLHVVKPGVAAAPGGAADDQGDLLTEGLARLRLEPPRRGGGGGGGGSGGGGTRLLVWSQRTSVADHVQDAVATALQHRPAFDDMKIRFNFGKHFFYNGVSASTAWTVDDMRSRTIPSDFKSVYSNALSRPAAAAIKRWLAVELGFELLERKERASVHLLHRESNASNTLSFDKGGGSLRLRKVKSANSKLVFATLLSPPALPDWRAKLLAQYSFEKDTTGVLDMLRRVAAGARLAAGADSPRVVFPALAAEDLEVDRERHKSKEVFAGIYSGSGSGSGGGSGGSSELKVTFSTATDGGGGAEVLEVAGTCARANELMNAALAASSAGGVLGAASAEELRGHVERMVEFAREAVVAAGGA